MKRVYDINSNVYCKSLTPGLVIQYHTGIVQAVRTEFKYLCPLDSNLILIPMEKISFHIWSLWVRLFYISQQRIVKYRSATATIYALPPCPSSIGRSRKATKSSDESAITIYATEKLYRMKASKYFTGSYSGRPIIRN